MVEEGALRNVDAVIALHVDASTPPGTVKIVEGPMLAAMDQFELIIEGRGCHGAYPHKGLDPIFISAQVLNFLYGLISRHVNPVEKAVISIGKIAGGDASNIIPSQVEIRGTVRTFSSETRDVILRHLRNIAEIILTLGGSYKLRFTGSYPATVNDPEVTRIIIGTASDMLGAGSVISMEPQLGSEDFGFYARQVPGAIFYLGAALPDHTHHIHHNSNFDIDDSILYAGSAILAECALRLLKTKKDLSSGPKT